MKSRKMIYVILTTSMILFLIMTGLLISIHNVDKQSTNTTTEYSATISDLEIDNNKNNPHVKIKTYEFNSYIYISTNVIKNINSSNISNLSKGKLIIFRIQNNKIDQFNKVEFIDIVSLKTKNMVVFSLADYNQYTKEAFKPTRITGLIFSNAFLLISTFCIIILKKKNKTNSKVGTQSLASYTYSANNGALTRMTYGTGQTVSYVYDHFGNVTRKSMVAQPLLNAFCT